MLRILTVASFALALSLPVTAVAQDQGVDQLKEEIMTAPEMTGMDIDLDSLSDEQIIEISGILQGDETDEQKRDRIRAMLDM